MAGLKIFTFCSALLVTLAATNTVATPVLPAGVTAAECPNFPFFNCSPLLKAVVPESLAPAPAVPSPNAPPQQPANPAGVRCFNFPFFPCSP
ncbi:actin cytoskeleton-regulatory complex protein PAN1-like [Hyalella azteca]|uniref:Actin cytoskeleton-regulatory complex protein PAN1-like n=1 Tax=Hyalella azteca TaxID=294128 RepID=A0A979FHM5_HYAAZ|nr:actin cytoskeleton-regulatory complex protein PAN1-like [Hyalella azteca]